VAASISRIPLTLAGWPAKKLRTERIMVNDKASLPQDDDGDDDEAYKLFS
jgi:hypothetical protein